MGGGGGGGGGVPPPPQAIWPASKASNNRGSKTRRCRFLCGVPIPRKPKRTTLAASGHPNWCHAGVIPAELLAPVVVTVRVVAPLPAIDVGLKLQEAPTGKPEQDAEEKLTVPLYPSRAVMVSSRVPLLPGLAIVIAELLPSDNAKSLWPPRSLTSAPLQQLQYSDHRIPRPLIRRPKLVPELIGCEPLMVIGGFLVLLIVEQLQQGAILLRAPLEHEKHTIHGQVWWSFSAIKRRSSQKVGVACENRAMSFVNRLDNQGGHYRIASPSYAGEEKKK